MLLLYKATGPVKGSGPALKREEVAPNEGKLKNFF